MSDYLRSGEDGNPGVTPRFPKKVDLAQRQEEALRLVASKHRLSLKTPAGRLKATQLALEADPTLVMTPEQAIRYRHRNALQSELREFRNIELGRIEHERRENDERVKLAENQFQETWHGALTAHGLVQDLDPNERNPDTLADYQKAVTLTRELLMPNILKALS